MRTTLIALAALPALAVARTPAGQTAPMAMPGMSMPEADGRTAPCPATPAPLPADLAGWTAAVPMTAATATSGLALATLRPGRGVVATLQPGATVRFPVAPGHPGELGSSGGLFAFAVTRAGTYRVALGAGAWVEVVKDGGIVASTAHGHGPACTPIRKMVDFALAPGRYLLEVSDNRARTLALMVSPVLP